MTHPIQTKRVLVTILFCSLLAVLGLEVSGAPTPEEAALAHQRAQALHRESLEGDQQEQLRMTRLADSQSWVVLSSEEGSLEQLFVDSSNADLASAAVTRLVQEKTQGWPEGYRRDFLGELSGQAIHSGVENRLPPSVTLAQAVLESGWGRSGLATQHKNLFGLKSGAHSDGVILSSWEGGGATRTRHKSRFRAYDDWSESLAHHNLLISTDRRYQEARAAWMNWEAFIDELAPVYATDPEYVTRVSQIVERYDLDAWDGLVAQRVAKHQR